jgi:hypothetical protein
MWSLITVIIPSESALKEDEDVCSQWQEHNFYKAATWLYFPNSKSNLSLLF